MRLLALALLLLPVTTRADDPAPRRSERKMLGRIDPSPEQCAALAGIARRADEARARLEEEKRTNLQPFRDALRQLHEEVVRDRGLDALTMKAASSLKERLKEAQTRFAKDLSGLEEEALAVLTPAQRARAGLDREAAPAGDDLAELRREIADVHEELYGAAGPLGRWLAAPGTADALAARGEGRTLPKPRQAAPPWAPVERETRELRREINLWNLVNGLHLTGPQLLAIARADRRGAEACARVLAALTPEQQEVLFTYKACLVPPRNLRDPVRAGQADDTSAAEKLLAKLRNVPDRRYATNEERLIDATLRGIEAREGGFSPDDRIWALLLLARTVRTARAMEDIEFQARAGECAEELTPLYRLKSMKEELRDRAPRDAVLREKTRAFLLDPVMSRVCERRIEQLRAGEAVVPEGPLERAPQCPGEGECGRP